MEWKSEKSIHSGYITESLRREVTDYLDDADSVEVDTDTASLPFITLEHSGNHERKRVPVIAAGRPAKLYVRWGIAGQYVVDILKNQVVGAPFWCLWRGTDLNYARRLCETILDKGRLAHARTDEESTRERLKSL